MELSQDVYTEYFSEAIEKYTKWSNCASLTCISEGWFLNMKSQKYLYQFRTRFLLFRLDEWERLLRSLNIHIFAFPISLSVRKLWSIVSHYSGTKGRMPEPGFLRCEPGFHWYLLIGVSYGSDSKCAVFPRSRRMFYIPRTCPQLL